MPSTTPTANLLRLVAPLGPRASEEQAIRRASPDLHRALLLARLLIGIVTVLLPAVLVVADLWGDLRHGRHLNLPGALSDYYYASAPWGDWFVGCLFAIGVGLMGYMATRARTMGNTISWVSGLAAVGLALFPTRAPGGPATVVSQLHVVFGVVLVLGVALLSVGFANDEAAERPPMRGRISGRILVHLTAAALIVGAILLGIAHVVVGLLPVHGVLIAELIAGAAFSVSWIVKGLELVAVRSPAIGTVAAALS